MREVFFLIIFSIFSIIYLFSYTFPNFISKADEFISSGDFDSALRMLTSYSKFYNEFSPSTKLQVLIRLSLINWNLGKIDSSHNFIQQAIDIAKENQLPEQLEYARNILEIHNLYSKGKQLTSDRQYQSSIAEFKKAISLSEQINAPAYTLKCIRLLSLNYLYLQDYYNFYVLNSKALNLAYQINHKREQSRCLNNLGIYYWKIDNYSNALDCFSKALSIAQQITSLSDESDILSNMGLVYRDIGNFQKAENCILSSLEIDKKLNNKVGICINRLSLGSIYRKMWLLTENLNYIDRAIAIYKENMNDQIDSYLKIITLNNIGSALNDKKKYHEAIELFNDALNVAESLGLKEEKSQILNNLAISYTNLGNYEIASKFHREAISIALEIKSGQILWEAYLELANLYSKKGDYQEALKNYKNSISIIEDIRSKLNLEEYKSTYLGSDKRLSAYYRLIDLLVQLGHKEQKPTYWAEAYNYLEKAKARAFLDSLEISKIAFYEGIDQHLRYQEVEIMSEISFLYTKLLNPGLTDQQKQEIYEKLDAADQKLETLKREMRATNPAYANLRYPEFVDLPTAQKKLIPRNVLVISYLLSPDCTYAFALTAKKLKIYPLPPLKELQEKTRRYLRSLSDVEEKDFSLGKELYHILLEPALERNINKIIVIPDDVLHYLPFETLIVSEDKDRPVWLIEKYPISYAPSVTSLKEILDRKNNGPKPKKLLLAVGDPSFETDGNCSSSEAITLKNFEPGADLILERLKFSSKEIESIASFFPPKKREILLADQASEENVKGNDLKQFRVVHFATHCLIDDKKPARSSIILRLDQDPLEDGLLQMREIFNLRFHSDLVVLSACQTGFGPFIRGEGIEGLSRAFFYAGASSLLLTLWPINDQATSQLMARFYHHLRSHNPIEVALQKAKLELIHSGVLSHPFYWAGFIVSGDTDRVILPRPGILWLAVPVSLSTGIFLFFFLKNGKKGRKGKLKKRING